jgi:hypothetical protein
MHTNNLHQRKDLFKKEEKKLMILGAKIEKKVNATFPNFVEDHLEDFLARGLTQFQTQVVRTQIYLSSYVLIFTYVSYLDDPRELCGKARGEEIL